ncbi:proline dehydrogenase family protein [Bacillus sp. V59.32b]|uniref:proline dehydrogenase family protein n=1 Tax=Bacillus sp. V59.32b TaxID=1758642 RepID=UPI000E3BD178|nr:proline dehydrogenase family protein [Bacillus sp. V59.32b]RFU67146.1 proline dehydrogenase [Bacillus sp. V59.32b]
MFSKDETRFSKALKSVARNEDIKKYIQESPELYPLFMRAAKRFVSGEKRQEGINKVKELIEKDYFVSIEYIGENTRSKEECIASKEEFISLIRELGKEGIQSTVSFDLSHIGMSIDRELALKHIEEMAHEAKRNHLNLMISMEESEKTEPILDIYKQVASSYDNVGITLQVHLKRSLDDLHELFHYPGKIRIVKGAYQEPLDIMIPRSEELDNRYLQFIAESIAENQPISIATHDEKLLGQIIERGYLAHSTVEVEMLDGARPDLIKRLC